MAVRRDRLGVVLGYQPGSHLVGMVRNSVLLQPHSVGYQNTLADMTQGIELCTNNRCPVRQTCVLFSRALDYNSGKIGGKYTDIGNCDGQRYKKG